MKETIPPVISFVVNGTSVTHSFSPSLQGWADRLPIFLSNRPPPALAFDAGRNRIRSGPQRGPAFSFRVRRGARYLDFELGDATRLKSPTSRPSLEELKRSLLAATSLRGSRHECRSEFAFPRHELTSSLISLNAMLLNEFFKAHRKSGSEAV